MTTAAAKKKPRRDGAPGYESRSVGDFFDSMTGGSFGAKVRAADETRANLVYTNGSELIAYLRAARPTIAWHSIAVFLILFVAALLVLSPIASKLISKTPSAISSAR